MTMRPTIEVPLPAESSPKATSPPSPDSLSGPRFELNASSCASGPLPSPGETLVGVVDSTWPLHNPRGLFPGDILLRIGRRGQPGTLRAPFPQGLRTVKQSLELRGVSDEVVLVQVLRGSSKLELLVSLVRNDDVPEKPGAPHADAGENREPEAHQHNPDTLCSGAHGEGVFDGVKLAEGKHADFAPLAARTEYCILRIERMKAYGLPLEPPCTSAAADAVAEARGARRALRLFDGGSGAMKAGVLEESEEGEDSGSDAGSSDSGGEEMRHREYHRSLAGSLLSVAPSVLMSDPALHADEDDLTAGSFAFRFDPAAYSRRDVEESSSSAEFSLYHPELMSGPLGLSTQSAPGASAPDESDELRNARNSTTFRMYTRPSSPRTALVRHASQPDMLASQPASSVLQHQLSSSPPRSGAQPSFQIRRRSIPEGPIDTSAKGGQQGAASLFTILVLPAESTSSQLRKSNNGLHRRFSDVNHTVERAMRWFQGAKNSGVALELKSAQTEVLPLRLGGMDSQKLAKVAQYGKWIVKTGAGDSARGDHVSVLRAVRLWLVPMSEVELTLCLSSKEDSCPDWGIQLGQTPQGIIHVVSVAAGSAADKAGVKMLLRMAEAKKQLLTVTKIQAHNLVPSMISDDGVDCVDIDAIREQLILHAHLQSPLQLTLAL